MEWLFALLGALLAFLAGFGLGWWLSGLRDPRLRLALPLVSLAFAVGVCQIADFTLDGNAWPPKFHASLQGGLKAWDVIVICVAIIASVVVFRTQSSGGNVLTGDLANSPTKRLTLSEVFLFLKGQRSQLSRVQRRFLDDFIDTHVSASAVTRAKKESLVDCQHVLSWMKAKLAEARAELGSQRTGIDGAVQQLDKILAALRQAQP